MFPSTQGDYATSRHALQAMASQWASISRKRWARPWGAHQTLAMLDPLTSTLRLALARQVRSLAGDSRAALDFTHPAGDPGWFGPDSVAWRVHADFVAMMTGGMGALLLQALHPLALAAVWDYSDFRDDLRGRLHRTALFIATTTYGPTAAAQAMVDRVRAIHAKVRGTAPDGRAYSADDPHLLSFIHAAEVYSFVTAYDWLLPPSPDASHAPATRQAALTSAGRDAYVAEMARVPLALGATEVARDWSGLLAQLESYRPELEGGARPQAILRMLRGMARSAQSLPATETAVPRLQAALGGRLQAVPLHLMMTAATALLPPWAQQLYGLPAPRPLQLAPTRAALRTAVPLMRWALRDGVAAQARQRVGMPHNPPTLSRR